MGVHDKYSIKIIISLTISVKKQDGHFIFNAQLFTQVHFNESTFCRIPRVKQSSINLLCVNLRNKAPVIVFVTE